VDVLCNVSAWWGGQNVLTHLKKNMLKCILSVVSAMVMVGLMWWNTGNNSQFMEFHFEDIQECTRNSDGD
jgi:hypothetical protein